MRSGCTVLPTVGLQRAISTLLLGRAEVRDGPARQTKQDDRDNQPEGGDALCGKSWRARHGDARLPDVGGVEQQDDEAGTGERGEVDDLERRESGVPAAVGPDSAGEPRDDV